MGKSFWKKLGFGFIYFVAGIYLLFLILPIFINPFLGKYGEQIAKMAEESCGLKIKIEKLRIVTTPKLTIGLKIGYFAAALPNGEEIVSAENTQAKLSLVPLASKKLEIDMFSIDDIDATLKVKPDGNLEIIDYLPEAKDKKESEQLTSLPLGLKLSNRLPNVYIKEYMLTMVDMRDKREYTVQGGNLSVTDFVLDKNVKFSTVGVAKLDGVQFLAYNLKIYNKIMPDLDLNDLIFAQNSVTEDTSQEKKTPSEPLAFNFIDILKNIKANGLTADVTMNIETTGKVDDIHIVGLTDITKLSMLVNGERLPDGHIMLKFKGRHSVADITLYTAKDEASVISGEIVHGNNPRLNLTVKSKAGINNIFNILKCVASSLNYHDIDTLSGTGNIDADFNIDADMKKVLSNGYFKIPQGSVKYALYNILLDKITADIDFSNNNVNIKDIGLTILSQPLKIYGTISDKAVADVHIKANNLLIKGLLTAAGQINLLKENDIKSGTLSADAIIKGDLRDIKPVVDIAVNNVNLLNKPSDTTVKLSSAKVNLSVDGNTYKGVIDANSMNIKNPAASVILPKFGVTLNEKDINIADSYMLFGNSRFDISGKITDYTSKAVSINAMLKGNLLTNDVVKLIPYDMRNLFSAKGSMPVIVKVTGNDKSQIITIQLLATPSGYLKFTDLQSISGKSLLLNSDISISGNNLTLTNTGAFAGNKNTLSQDTASNISGTQILKVSGGANLSNMNLRNLNVSTVQPQVINVPSYIGSKVALDANVTLNGNAMNPEMKGFIKCPSVSVPSMKTTLKDLLVELGNSITVDLPEISVADSKMNAKAIVSNNFSNGVIIKNLDFKSSYLNSDSLIAELAKMPSGSGGSQSSDIGVIIQNGKGNIEKFKSGKIIATNLSSDFNLKNNIFTLKNLTGNAFDGKIDGVISVNVISGNTNVTMKGSGMKAVDAIAATAGINNALSGLLDFDAKLVLNSFEPDFNALLKSVRGSADFEIKDGTYMNIGTIDQLVLANNVLSNAVLKAAVSQIKTLPVVKNSSKFNDITGKVNLKNGVATLSPVRSSGMSVSYYVTGDYNLITGYTNVNILGRMGADLVKALGALGDLSVSKISTYLPKFGQNTISLLSALTSNPATEKTSLIPALTGDIPNYKDFKVIFNGNIMSVASVKSFKWLSTCDTSEITTGTAAEQIKNSINDTKQQIQTNVDSAKKQAEETKQQFKKDVETAKQQAEEAKANAKAAVEDVKKQYQTTKDTFNELKNMFKTPATTAPTSTAPASTDSAETTVQPAAATGGANTESNTSDTSSGE
ncbi:hypothetical protein IKP85_00410 [bacterium]|nr:hypothetical protein [bacterium]